MSLSIADYSSRIRDSLVHCRDSVLSIPPMLTELSLTTVMGSCQDSGKEDRAARVRALKENSTLASLFSGLADDDARKNAYSSLAAHIKAKVDARLIAVHDETLARLVEHCSVPVDTSQSCAAQIDTIFADTKNLVQCAIKQDDAMTPQRRQAIEDFNSSVKMVTITITSINKIERQISQVQEQLNLRFDSENIMGTASDTARTELSNLRKDLEGQRAYQERQLLTLNQTTSQTTSQTT